MPTLAVPPPKKIQMKGLLFPITIKQCEELLQRTEVEKCKGEKQKMRKERKTDKERTMAGEGGRKKKSVSCA